MARGMEARRLTSRVLNFQRNLQYLTGNLGFSFNIKLQDLGKFGHTIMDTYALCLTALCRVEFVRVYSFW